MCERRFKCNTPSEIVYGNTLRLPEEFLKLSKEVLNPTSLVIKIKGIINLIIPKPVSH